MAVDASLQAADFGRFGEALRHLRLTPSRPNRESPACQTLLAELLERTGQDNEAARTARLICSQRGLSPAFEARCRVVIGDVHRHRGEVESALGEYRKAINLATRSNSQRVVCWAQLRMLLAEADGPGLESARKSLQNIRRNIARAGSAFLATVMHLYVAQIEAQRGLLKEATEHIRIARSLLLSQPENPWLGGLAAVDSACVAFADADFVALSAESRIALALGVESGEAAITKAALVNLGHAELTAGRFEAAKRCMIRAWNLSERGGPIRAAISDGLAQLHLANGQLSAAERVLRHVPGWSSQSPTGAWYYGLWTSVTRGRLLIRQGRLAEAAQLLQEAVLGASTLADPILTTSLHLLLCETLARSGHHSRAFTPLVAAIDDSEAFGRALFPETSRVIANSVGLVTGLPSAGPWFERSASSHLACGNRHGLVGVVEDCAEAATRDSGRAGEPGTDLSNPAHAASAYRPRSVVRRLDASRPLLGTPPNGAVLSTERAAAILDTGGQAPTLGDEAMNLLLETASAPTAVLASSAKGGDPEISSWFGCGWNAARALSENGGRRIALGAWQDREYAICLAPPNDPAALVTMVAIERLVAGARFQHQAKVDETPKAALWPVETGETVDDAVFASDEMHAVVATARRVSAMNVIVLITGETGTGKEVLARLIHTSSPRAGKPFVPFNCTAVPRDLADSHLFGYKRGAFTGAVSDSPGVVRAATGGTLLLDEIGELGLDVQPKLLRLIEYGEVLPLGETRPVRPDVRIVASTNRNLEQLVADGLFREDLFYRLNVVPLRIPPLRERREEIPLLADHFLQRFALEFGKSHLQLAAETVEYLLLYPWSGNVRQLANEMRRLAAMAEPDAVLTPEHLAPGIRAERRTVSVAKKAPDDNEIVIRLDQPHPAALELLERAQIAHAMKASGGRVEDAAQLLGLSRKGLYLKRQRLGLA